MRVLRRTGIRQWQPPDSIIARPKPSPPPRPLLTDAQLRQLQRLSFAPDALSMTGLSGEHRSRRRGPSPEFADFKPYSPGDDFRRIDWNTYARLDQLFIRESETTTERDIDIFIDLSASMDWTSDEAHPTKLTHAASIAGLLGYIAIWHFDRCSIKGFGGAPAASFGPVQGRSNVLRMFRFCQDLAPGSPSPDDAIQRHLRRRKRPGRMFILSDFLWAEPAMLRETLLLAASRRWQTTLILVQDPAEVHPAALFDDSENLEFLDAESSASMRVGADRRSLERYVETRQAWLAELALSVSGLPGATWVTATNADAGSTALLRDLVAAKVLQR